jgi:hypothetical protein
MTVSTDAILFWGFIYFEDAEFPWDNVVIIPLLAPIIRQLFGDL